MADKRKLLKKEISEGIEMYYDEYNYLWDDLDDWKNNDTKLDNECDNYAYFKSFEYEDKLKYKFILRRNKNYNYEFGLFVDNFRKVDIESVYPLSKKRHIKINKILGIEN